VLINPNRTPPPDFGPLPDELSDSSPSDNKAVKNASVETVSPMSYAGMGTGVVILVIAGVLFTRRLQEYYSLGIGKLSPLS